MLLRRLKLCVPIDRDEINPVSALLNFLAACMIIGAVLGDWITIEGGAPSPYIDVSNSTSTHHRQTTSIEELKREFSASNCTSIGSTSFLLPARFTSVSRNGKHHILYYYNGEVFMDCIAPHVADYFYLITALCFISMSVSVFSALLHSMAPPFPFFNYLRMITVLEVVVCAVMLLVFFVNRAARGQVEELQEYAGENSRVSMGASVWMIVMCGCASLCSAIHAQRRQSRIRRARFEDNQRLICTRPLRSRRDASQQQILLQDPQSLLNLERYLLEPGLRPQSTDTTCVDDEQEEASKKEEMDENHVQNNDTATTRN